MDRLQLRAALPVAILLAVIAGGAFVGGQRLDGGVRLNGGVQGAYAFANSGLATTSTDGFSILNNTAATAGVPVQMSPRLKSCGSAYNSVSTLSETDCMFAEVLPATAAGTTSQTWKLGSIINGGAATYPLTVNSSGLVTTTGHLGIGTGFGIFFGSRAVEVSPADGVMTVANQALTIGSNFKADALPTVSSGFGTSPSITAGSTPLAGSVNVGTGGVATTGVINFNGTAFPSAPFCTATPTTSNVVQRVSTSTTQLTLTVTTAWTASDVIFFQCISSK